MKKKISRKAGRKFERKVIRETRGKMVNPVENADYLAEARKKLEYALKRLARIEGSYGNLIDDGAELVSNPKWVYFDRQARKIDRDWFTVENW